VTSKDPEKVVQYKQSEWEWIRKVATLSPEKLLLTMGMGTGMDKAGAWFHRNFFFENMDNITAAGGQIMGTPMMRCGTLIFNLASAIHPFVISKTFESLQKKVRGDTGKLIESLLAAGVRSKILAETRAEAKKGSHPGLRAFAIVLDNPSMLWPWSADPEPNPQDAISKRAKREGTTSLDLCFDILTHPEAEHNGVLMKYLYNYGNGDLEPLLDMMNHQKVVPGFADGGAHMLVQCEATTPTVMLTHWVRDRTRGPKMPVEMVVKKQTADSAAMMGLYDRGELRPGMKADINVISLDELRILSPEFRTDLPLGAGRWVQEVEGYRLTMVNGVVIFENGKPTGALPGHVVHNPRSVGLQGSLRGSVPAATEKVTVENLDLSEHALKLASQGGVGMSGVQRALKEGAPAPARGST